MTSAWAEASALEPEADDPWSDASLESSQSLATSQPYDATQPFDAAGQFETGEESEPQPSTAFDEPAADSDGSWNEQADPWSQPETSELGPSDAPLSEDEHVGFSQDEASGLSQDEATGFSQDEATGFSQDEATGFSEDEQVAPADDDVVEGSLASMLIQDLQSEPAEPDLDLSHSQSGTFLMDAPEESAWESPEAEATESPWADSGERSTYEESGELEGGEPTPELSEGSWSGESEESESASYQDSDAYEGDEDDYSPTQPFASDLDSESFDDTGESAYDSVAAAPLEEEVAPEPQPVAEDSGAPDVEEDSIEAYMNRLLQRVQTDSEGDADKPETISLSTSASLTESQLSATNTLEAVEESQEPIDPDAPLVPRSEAPEQASLSALRELANESARSAITRSARLKSRNVQLKGATNFFFAAVALACGCACLFFLPGVMRYLAVAMTIVVGVVCTIEGFQHFKDAQRMLNSSDDTDFEVDEEFEVPSKGDADADPKKADAE